MKQQKEGYNGKSIPIFKKADNYLAAVEGDQLREKPKAEICAFQNNQCLRVATTLIEDNRLAAKEAILNAHPMLKKIYRADDDNTQVFYMTNSTATFSAHGKELKIYAF